jgi:succinate dehydrogenase hydrophobic anchor subunit
MPVSQETKSNKAWYKRHTSFHVTRMHLECYGLSVKNNCKISKTGERQVVITSIGFSVFNAVAILLPSKESKRERSADITTGFLPRVSAFLSYVTYVIFCHLSCGRWDVYPDYGKIFKFKINLSSCNLFHLVDFVRYFS